MTDSFAPDWEAFVRRHEALGLAEIDLGNLRSGDRLLIITEHTAYTFAMVDPQTAELTTNRDDRPAGRVRINGCTFGASSSIKPHHLFCGGNVEFMHGEPCKLYTTTKIRALQVVQADARQA